MKCKHVSICTFRKKDLDNPSDLFSNFQGITRTEIDEMQSLLLEVGQKECRLIAVMYLRSWSR